MHSKIYFFFCTNENKTIIYIDMHIDVWEYMHIYKEICLCIYQKKSEEYIPYILLAYP